MKYAIIAAGEGSRLAYEGISDPKPLVRLNGECLIDRLIRIFVNHDAEEIVCICNDKTAQVAQHLVALQRDGLRGRPVPLRFVVKSTPSSMHSFFEISRYLADEPFVMTTVDTIFPEHEFTRYIEAFKTAKGDGLMGVTDFVDDEKPLYVQTDQQLTITAFCDEPCDCSYVSAGIYGLHPNAIYTLSNCIARGMKHLRSFQRAMISDGRKLTAWPFSKVFDIDHADDLVKAQEFLSKKS